MNVWGKGENKITKLALTERLKKKKKHNCYL